MNHINSTLFVNNSPRVEKNHRIFPSSTKLLASDTIHSLTNQAQSHQFSSRLLFSLAHSRTSRLETHSHENRFRCHFSGNINRAVSTPKRIHHLPKHCRNWPPPTALPTLFTPLYHGLNVDLSLSPSRFYCVRTCSRSNDQDFILFRRRRTFVLLCFEILFHFPQTPSQFPLLLSGRFSAAFPLSTATIVH